MSRITQLGIGQPKPTPSPAYVEVVSSTIRLRHDFCYRDLREIGEFTRDNVLAWMNAGAGGWRTSWEAVGIIEDFHAVCGDIDIPWADPEMAAVYVQAEKAWEEHRRRGKSLNDGKR